MEAKAGAVVETARQSVGLRDFESQALHAQSGDD